MILNYHAEIKMVRALCKNSGLTMVFHNKDGAWTDGTTLHVPRPSADYTDDQWTLWKYMVLHEAGHNEEDNKDVFDLVKEKKVNMKSFFGYVLNLLDDHRQEWASAGEYEGKDLAMDKGRAVFYQHQIDKGLGEVSGEKERIARALYTWDSIMRTDFQPRVTSPAYTFHDGLDAETSAIVDKLLDSGLRFVPRDITAEEEWQLVKDILTYLEVDADEEEEKATSSDGKGDESEDGEGKEGATDGGRESKDADGGSESGEEGDEDYSKYLFHKHDESKYGDSYKEVSHSLTDDGYYGHYVMGKVTVLDWRHSISRPVDKYYKIEIDGLGASGKGLANTVRKLLQVYSQSHYRHGLKRGKLGKNLHRACMANAGGYSQRVFKKKEESMMLDTSVALLVDMSGSMSGGRYAHAAKAAILLNEAIAKAGIPLEIVGFTEFADGPTHVLYKGYHDRVSSSHLTDAFAAGGGMLSENADGESMLWMYNRLKQQPTKRKVLITLSDGAPAGYKRGIGEFTKKVSEGMKKDRDVELYGIGILDDSVKEYYSEYSVLKDVNQLESTLINVIKRKIFC